MPNLPQDIAAYDEDAADQAAAALLWMTGRQERVDEPWTVSPRISPEIIRRLELRGWVVHMAGMERLALTPLGRRRCEELFGELLGEARPATLPRQHEAHVVREEDGE